MTSHSTGLEERRHFIEWEVTRTSIYSEECFGKVKGLGILKNKRIFYLSATDEG